LLGAVDAERPLYGETYHPYLRYGWSSLLSVVAGRWHLIEGPVPELYDIVADPAERRQIVADHPEIRERLLPAVRAVHEPPEPPFAESEEVRGRLAALGYLDFGGAHGSGQRPDPKSRLASLQRLRGAVDDLRSGRLGAAEQALRALTVEDPESLEAWQFLGEVYREQGRWQEAYDALARAFALGNGAPLLAPSLAQCAYELGRPEEAVELLAIAVAGSPHDAALRFRRVGLLLQLQRGAEAAAAAEETVRVIGEGPDALFQLALAQLAAGDAGRAEAALRRALALAPDHTAALYQLALLRAAQGDAAEARHLLEQVLRVAPGDEHARRALAELVRGAS
jgi:tetratricopeptide (TPR) repeat protein